MGRHRGTYSFRMLWPRGIFTKGLHRGKYEPKPEWSAAPVATRQYADTPEAQRIKGLIGLPIVAQPAPSLFKETGGRFGEFGDSAFDLVDRSVLRGPLSA